MKGKIYAVLDTNVIVSSLLTPEGNCGKIFSLIERQELTILISEEIMEEYVEVLHRKKFNFEEKAIYNQILTIRAFGEPTDLFEKKINEKFIDNDDIVFYSITLEGRKNKDVSLITGNIRHFPIKIFIVTPDEFLRRIKYDADKI